MKPRDFTHPDVPKAAAESAGLYIGQLRKLGYTCALSGHPRPGEFIIHKVEGGFRVLVSAHHGRAAIAPAA